MTARSSHVLRAVLRDAYAHPLPRAAAGPLVTVVVAAYDRSEVLRYALRSALRQDYADLEVLVVGDACTDASEQVVAAFADPRVRWTNLPVNTGSAAGPNQAGLELARGELVAYLGQDDLWRRDHLALLVGAQQRTGADAVHTACAWVWPGGIHQVACPVPGTFAAPSSLLHRRAAVLAAGGWRDHRTTVLAPDRDVHQRLVEAGTTFARATALSVVKFPSAARRDSYRDGRSGEQARATARLDGRGFVAREVALAVLGRPAARWARPRGIDPAAATVPGGLMEEFRRIRGLGPSPQSS